MRFISGASYTSTKEKVARSFERWFHERERSTAVARWESHATSVALSRSQWPEASS
jgi:hypothetical protein